MGAYAQLLINEITSTTELIMLKSIPQQAQSFMTIQFVQGKTNQQVFSATRNAGHNITYQQVTQLRAHTEGQFNSAFASIFQS